MTRLRFPLLAAICLIAPAAAVRSAPAPAERSGLEQVPATAPIVFYLRGVQGTRDRLVTMMENALPDVLKKFQPDMDNFLKDGAEGRKIRGLAKNGPVFLAFTELPKPAAGAETPKFAIILAVTNYAEFRDNILTEDERKTIKDKGNGIEVVTIKNESQPTYFVDRKGFAIVTPNEEVAESFTKKQTGLNTKMSKELAAKLLAGDAGMYVNMDAVNKEYGEQIKQSKDGIEQLLGPLGQAGDDSQKQIVEMFTKAIGPIFQAVEDMHSILATVEFRPGGLAVHLESEVNENTTTAGLLQDTRPVAFKELERMPADRAFYLGMKGGAALYKNLGAFIAGIPSAGTKDAGNLLEELGKAGPDTMLSSFSIPMAGLNVYRFDDPAKAVAANLKMYRNMDPKSASLKDKPVVKTDAETYGDFKLHSVQLVYDFDKMAEQMAPKGGDEEAKKKAIEGLKKYLGAKTNVWFGTDGKTFVQVTASDWTAARKLLDRYTKDKDTAGSDKAFLAARKEMPARTSLLGLIDVLNMFGTMVEAFKPLFPAGQVPPGWPDMPAKKTASFVGLAVTLQPQRGGFDLFITAAAAQDFYKAVVKPLVGE